MPLQKLSVTGLDNENQRRRLPETINQILTHQFDDSRVQTAAEKLAGVPVVNAAFPPGDVRRYGAIGDGTTDDAAPFARAIAVSYAHEMVIPYTSNGYLIGTPLVAPGNCTIRGIGRPQLKAATNGQDIISAVSTSTFNLRGVRFLGTSASTTPTSNYGGYGATVTALVTCANVTDVLVEDCEFDLFYNGLATTNCDRVWMNKNRIRRFYFIGVLCSLSTQFSIERNIITECQQAGANIAYGITGTGDTAGGNTQTINSISFNQINGVPSWSGIMTHDVTGLIIIGNDIRDVRKGLDIGHFASTNVLNDIVISGNCIQSTATDTYSGGIAESGGILVEGYDSTHTVNNVTITGNVIRDFFRVVGMVGSGNPSNISVVHCTHVAIDGNTIVTAGSVISNAGVLVAGRCDSLSIAGNNFQGSMALGGIRFATVTSDVTAISGNTVLQNTTTDPGIQIVSSTLSAFNNIGNATNSSAPYVATSSTITYAPATTAGTYTGTLTQCTTAPTASIAYSVNGDLVTLSIPLLVATSANVNQPLVTGMPTELRPPVSRNCIGVVGDNSNFTIGIIRVETNGDLSLFFGITNVFTAANNKGVNKSEITFRRSA